MGLISVVRRTSYPFPSFLAESPSLEPRLELPHASPQQHSEAAFGSLWGSPDSFVLSTGGAPPAMQGSPPTMGFSPMNSAPDSASLFGYMSPPQPAPSFLTSPTTAPSTFLGSTLSEAPQQPLFSPFEEPTSSGEPATAASPAGSFQVYSPLLSPTPVHSSFEKIFLAPSNENGTLSNGTVDKETQQAFENFRLGNDPVIPLSSSSPHVERKGAHQGTSKSSRGSKETAPLDKSTNGSGGGKKQNRKRAKSKKGKVVLSLNDLNILADPTPPEEILEDNASPVLWVGNICPSVTESQILEEFSVYGNVINHRILRDKYCAFVTYDCPHSAARAKKHLDHEMIGEQSVIIHFRQPNGTFDNAVTNPPSSSLWIGNVSEDLTEDELRREFERYGPVESIRLLNNCAFVNFFAVEDATQALRDLQGKQVGRLNLRINYGKPKPHFEEDFSATSPSWGSPTYSLPGEPYAQSMPHYSSSPMQSSHYIPTNGSEYT